MPFSRIVIAVVVLSAALCAQTNPVPFVNNPLVPASVAPGGTSFTLTVNGTGFVPGSVVNWNGSPLATTYVSGSQLTAVVPAGLAMIPGTAPIRVVNPEPGGGLSNEQFLAVRTPLPDVAFNFSTFALTATPVQVYLKDLNQDGILDLISTDLSTAEVFVSLGAGNGLFLSSASYDVAGVPGSVATADFNRDGIVDLAVSAAGQVCILLGNGDGTFQSYKPAEGETEAMVIATGDFNGDGAIDIAATISFPDGTFDILLGNGDGTFGAPISSSASSGALTALVVGDFNRDGKLDITALVRSHAAVSVVLGNGDGTFQEGVEYLAASIPGALVTADFNNDSVLDLAVYGETTQFSAQAGIIAVLLGTGDGTFGMRHQLPTPVAGFNSLVAVDLNGDNALDLIANAPRYPNIFNNLNTVSTLLGNGDGSFKKAGQFPTGLYPVGVAVGDLNSDGMVDVVTANNRDVTGSTLLQINSVLTPTSIIFPKTKVGSSSTAVCTLTNYGNSDLQISAIGLTGNYASLFHVKNDCPQTLGTGESCHIGVTFTPTAALRYMGTRLQVVDNASNKPQIVFLQGRGTSQPSR